MQPRVCQLSNWTKLAWIISDVGIVSLQRANLNYVSKTRQVFCCVDFFPVFPIWNWYGIFHVIISRCAKCWCWHKQSNFIYPKSHSKHGTVPNFWLWHRGKNNFILNITPPHKKTTTSGQLKKWHTSCCTRFSIDYNKDITNKLGSGVGLSENIRHSPSLHIIPVTFCNISCRVLMWRFDSWHTTPYDACHLSNCHNTSRNPLSYML